ncbi:putative membrane protein [Arthrobacter sp. B3I9]|uniref:hypothetical protein n=1 Tax=Arthrobacter sp. B3I9 TaxID=3042270 RepID=UPI00278ED5D2|nr:hypothetical protein [Arthrobacter sp. B3I9]MDQ0850656.1 putative membrane protein [Arthrobacter sp. B3I9]
MRRRYVGLILLVFVVVALVNILFMLGQMIHSSQGQPQPSSEILLPLFLIVGLVVLLTMLMAVALTTNFIVGRKYPEDRPGALGMPGGSVSAVIALLLLLVFAVFSVFFFNQIRAGEGDGFISRGVTADALKVLPQDRIIELNVENPQAEPTARTFAVKLAAAHRDSVDLAKNTATLVGTLLSAVAGFYFGGRATKMGAEVVKARTADGPATGKTTGGGASGKMGGAAPAEPSTGAAP